MQAIFLALIGFFLMTGCSSNGSSSGADNSPKRTVVGAIQKGPFVQGSVIMIQGLDSHLNATGELYVTETTDSTGSFTMPVNLKSSMIEIIATGYYFNEVSGSLSSSPLTLRAYADLNAGSMVNVNVMSQLSHDRIKALNASGRPYAAAQSQAEAEVLAVFNIPSTSASDFTKMDISRNGDANAVLLAVSSIVQGQNSVAQLTQFLAQMGGDISANGALTSATNQQQLKNNSMALDLNTVRLNVARQYANLGIQASIPNFENFVDSAGNGTINGILPPASRVPSLISAVPSETGATLVWTPIPGVFSYNVYRDGVRVNASPVLGPVFTDSALSSAQTYSYTVTSVNSSGESARSLSLSTTLPRLLAPGVLPTSVAVDNQNVYWSDSINWSAFTSSVKKIAIGGGSVVTLASGQAYTSSLGLSQGKVFWNDNGGAHSIATSGGSVYNYSAYGYSTQMAFDANNFYWGFSPVGIQKVAIAGGAVTTLSPEITVNNGQTVAAPYGIAVDASYAYWANWYGDVRRVPLSGGSSTTLLPANSQTRVAAIAIDSENIYLATTDGIQKMPLAGGAVTTLTTAVHPLYITINSGNIYWAESNRIGKISTTGGAPIILASGMAISYSQNAQISSNCLAVDSQNIYWGTKQGLFQMAK